MDHGTEVKKQDLKPQLRLVPVLFLIAGVSFLALILNPLFVGYFDASRTPDEALAYVRENLTALRWMFTGLGVIDLLLGSSLWLWGNQVRRAVPGGSATAATIASWAGLLGGVMALASRVRYAWSQSVDDLVSAATGEVSFEVGLVLFLTALVAWTTAFVIFGVLIVRGPMPTWLGIVLIGCGVLPWAGFLPLWYYIGAIVLGITVLVRLRQGKPVLSTSSAR
jgi:hypothetical protein